MGKVISLEEYKQLKKTLKAEAKHLVEEECYCYDCDEETGDACPCIKCDECDGCNE